MLILGSYWFNSDQRWPTPGNSDSSPSYWFEHYFQPHGGSVARHFDSSIMRIQPRIYKDWCQCQMWPGNRAPSLLIRSLALMLIHPYHTIPYHTIPYHGSIISIPNMDQFSPILWEWERQTPMYNWPLFFGVGHHPVKITSALLKGQRGDGLAALGLREGVWTDTAWVAWQPQWHPQWAYFCHGSESNRFLQVCSWFHGLNSNGVWWVDKSVRELYLCGFH